MQCSVCGSQDTKFVQGISKSGKNMGKPWKAYECNEPNCKNEKGYPNRTFVNTPRTPGIGKVPTPNGNPLASLEKKVDKILAILNANFPSETHEPIEEQTEESPF